MLGYSLFFNNLLKLMFIYYSIIFTLVYHQNYIENVMHFIAFSDYFIEIIILEEE